MKRWQFVLTTLAILFAPPFLITVAIQWLSWLLYRLFGSVSLPAWFGIKGYAVTVVGMHILISAVLMGLLVHRRRPPERWQFILTAVVVPLAMPFLALWLLSALMRLPSLPCTTFPVTSETLLSPLMGTGSPSPPATSMGRKTC